MKCDKRGLEGVYAQWLKGDMTQFLIMVGLLAYLLNMRGEDGKSFIDHIKDFIWYAQQVNMNVVLLENEWYL